MPKRKQIHSRLSAVCTFPNLVSLLFLFLCGVAGWWFLTQSDLDFSSPAALVESIQALGTLGVAAYIGFLIVAIVIGPVPSTPVTIAGGLVWGPLQASLYAVIGLALGSIAAYGIGRTLGRATVQALTGKVIYFSNHRGDKYLGWLVFVTHVFPFLPYDLVSYGAGVSGMSLPVFAVANVLGLVPNTLLLTYMGSSFGVGLPFALALVVVFFAMLLILPWGVRRHNWLGLRDTIRIE